MSDFSVDPAAFRTAASTFDTAGNQLSEALGALLAALADTGGMAGADKPGHRFSASYDGTVPSVESVTRTGVTGLKSIATGLRTTAENYRDADTTSAFPTDREP
ncbi:PE domain-containing protein [Frankia sp. AiPs1]|uniref:PE domain-containing protein n=1 Tax=Frankia sp. AiPs1 TaxID=573493 RepID=UPI00204451DD|nr:PE domain-containing protein [Frankia sp. AiPs1]MCM3921856.1 PE domain-containing protein [Frankia sp. AiPs1]